MGEQTQIQLQTQPQSQPHNTQSQQEPTSQSQSTPVTEPQYDLSQVTSNPSKIPVRPHKLRKLSTGVAASDGPEEKSPQVTDGESAKALTVFKNPTTTNATSSSATKNRRRTSSQSARVFPSVSKPLTAEGEIDLALHHLRAADPRFVDLINSFQAPAFHSCQSPFLALSRSILHQQLASKAGSSIYTRFVDLLGGEDGVRPDAVLELSTQQLRQIGVSARKAVYLFDLANKYKNGILSDGSILGMDDKSLFTMLSMVKGIGSWSVHMFMIFSLHRPDVLPVSDMGVRKGVQLLYGLEELPRPSQMEQLCDKWRPYRSVGSWYMWRLVEGKSVQSGTAPALEGVLPLQQQIGHREENEQHHLQLLEPINGTGNFGTCIWGH